MPVHLGSMDSRGDDHPSARRRDVSRRGLHAERARRGRHAPAGHHRDHAGVDDAGGVRSTREPRPPCGHRRDHARLDAAAVATIDDEGVSSTASSLSTDGRFLEAETRALLRGGGTPRASPTRTSPTSRRSSPATSGRGRTQPDGSALRARRGAAPTWPRAGPCRGDRRGFHALSTGTSASTWTTAGGRRARSPSTAPRAGRSTSPARARSKRRNFNAP